MTTTSTTAPTSGVDRYFEITARGSSVGRELRGGLVTFFAMAYIIALNPIIVGTSPDVNGNLVSGLPISDPANIGTTMAMVAAGTALVAGVMTLLMAFVGRYPMAIATGLGLNAMVAYGLVKWMTWPQAMGLIFWEGIVITVLVLTGFRQAVFRAVPRPIRTAISVGIGLFIAFIGFVDARVVRPASPIVQLGDNGTLFGWPIFVFLLGLTATIIMSVKKVPGAILISIAGSTVVAAILEAVFHIGPNVGAAGKVLNPEGWALNVPHFTGVVSLPNLGTMFRCDPIGAFQTGPRGFVMALMTVFALVLSDFFDTMGTVVAVGSAADLLDDEGNPPRVGQILLVDALSAVAGGVAGVSSNTAFVESASGVGDGARTGLASVVTGTAFLGAMFFAPLVNIVPSEAVTPALVFVGYLMMTEVTNIDWTDMEEALPAFLAIILMPITYSITVGIGAGFITYALLKLVRGKGRELHPLLIGIAIAFVLYFCQGIIAHLIG